MENTELNHIPIVNLIIFAALVTLILPLPYLLCYDGCVWMLWPLVIPGFHIIGFLFNPLVLILPLIYALVIFFVSKKFAYYKSFFITIIYVPIILSFSQAVVAGLGSRVSFRYGFFKGNLFLRIFEGPIPNLTAITNPSVFEVSILLFYFLVSGTLIFVVTKLTGIASRIQLWKGYEYISYITILIALGAFIADRTVAQSLVSKNVYNAESIDQCFQPSVTNISRAGRLSEYKSKFYDVSQDPSLICVTLLAVKKNDISLCKDKRLSEFMDIKNKECEKVFSRIIEGSGQ